MPSQKRRRSLSVFSSASRASSPSSQRYLPHDTINPLSHSEGVIKQLRVAGLNENDLLPSTYITNFPHRPISPTHQHPRHPQQHGKRQEDYDDDNGETSSLNEEQDPRDTHDDDDDTNDDNDNDDHHNNKNMAIAKKRREAAAERLRDAQDQHLGLLIGVILRALEKGDIPRAKRAFGLLRRRSDIRGKPVDLRRHGLWTLGAEVLMRDGETRSRTMVSEGREEEEEEEDEDEAVEVAGGGDGPEDEEQVNDEDVGLEDYEALGGIGEAQRRRMRRGKGKRRRRWGSAANMPRLRTYLEGLIRQYPYNRLHPTSISDLDFYPVLFGCEFYNVWVDHRLALERLERDAETWSDDPDLDIMPDPADGYGYGYGYGDDDVDSHPVPLTGHERRLRHEKAQLALRALPTIRDVASRMDVLLQNAPYSRSVEMLRLRGMVALYLGDLSVPPPPRTEDEDEEATRVREEERGRARFFFAKMRESGGRVDGFVKPWLGENEDDDDDDDYGAYKDEDDLASGWSGLPFFSSLTMR